MRVCVCTLPLHLCASIDSRTTGTTQIVYRQIERENLAASVLQISGVSIEQDAIPSAPPPPPDSDRPFDRGKPKPRFRTTRKSRKMPLATECQSSGELELSANFVQNQSECRNVQPLPFRVTCRFNDHRRLLSLFPATCRLVTFSSLWYRRFFSLLFTVDRSSIILSYSVVLSIDVYSSGCHSLQPRG